jgi:hypothetical protein
MFRGRRTLNNPWGDLQRADVASANRVFSRCFCCIVLCYQLFDMTSMASWFSFAVEQPLSSRAWWLPSWRAVEHVRATFIHRFLVYHGNFHGQSTKGFVIHTCCGGFAVLALPKPKPAIPIKLVKQTPKAKVPGKSWWCASEDMKSSEHYSPEFGQAIADVHVVANMRRYCTIVQCTYDW